MKFFKLSLNLSGSLGSSTDQVNWPAIGVLVASKRISEIAS